GWPDREGIVRAPSDTAQARVRLVRGVAIKAIEYARPSAKLFVHSGLRVTIVALDRGAKLGRLAADFSRQLLDSVSFDQVAGVAESLEVTRAGVDEPKPVFGNEAPIAN